MAYLWFILFLLSIVGNGLLAWYIRKLIIQFNEGIQNLLNFQNSIDEYEEHLSIILAMDNYAGEPTIENLVKHTKIISQQMKEIGNSFSIQEEENEA